MAIDRAAALRNAETLQRQGKLPQAIEEYARVIADQPAEWNTRNAFGDVLVRAGQIERAIDEYRRVAEAFGRDGFHSKAAALYRKILKVRPDDEHAALQGAEIAASQGLIADARIALTTIAERRRARGDAAGELALAVRLGSLDANDYEARLRAASAMGQLGDRLGALTALRTLADELVACDPEGQTHADLLRRVLSATGEPDVERAVEALRHPQSATESAASPDPTNQGTSLPTVSADTKRERVDHAVSLTAPLGALSPTPSIAGTANASTSLSPLVDGITAVPASLSPSVTEVATAPQLGHRVPQIEVDLSVVLEQIDKPIAPAPVGEAADLDDVFARMRDEAHRRLAIEAAEESYRRGITLFRAGQIEESIAGLIEASATPRFAFDTAALLGRIFLNRGDLPRAVEWLGRAADAPISSPHEHHKVLYNLADALESSGESVRALAVLLELQSAAGAFRDVPARLTRLSATRAGG